MRKSSITTYGAIFLCICFLISLVACGNDSSSSSHSHSEKESSTDNNTVVGSVLSSEIICELSTVEESTAPIIQNNSFEGNIDYKDKLIVRTYKAPLTGTYRFDFKLTSNANARFRFFIKDSTNLQIVNEYNIGSSNGVTKNLIGGETYRLYFEQQTDFSTFEMKIGVPHPEVDIQGQSKNDSITYKDQNNHYRYTAPKTGKYRIECDPSDYTAYYYLSVTDATGVKKSNERFHGLGGDTVTLEAGQTYNIVVSQSDGFPYNYTLIIHIPNDIQTVTNRKIQGAITFTEQQNIYTFSVPVSGKYKFTMDTTDVNAKIDFCIRNEKKSTVVDERYISDGATFYGDLQAGQKYTAYVTQRNGACEYTIRFERA